MIGQLFTQDFLSSGIRETAVWQSITDSELDGFVGKLNSIYGQFRADSNLNEPVTENEINLSSLALDFMARQKVQGQHLNWYIVEQLPMILPDQFEEKIGRKKIAGKYETRASRRSRCGPLPGSPCMNRGGREPETSLR